MEQAELAELARLPLSTRLTAQFYAWEQWGRGWHLWPASVELEPPFRPFRFHSAPSPTNGVVDDGRRPTLLSSLFESIAGWGNPKAAERKAFAAWADEISEVPEPELIEAEPRLVELQITLAPDVKVDADLAEHFLISLASCSWPASFEVVGTAGKIRIQIAAHEHDVSLVRDQLRAHFPEAVITQDQEDILRTSWEEAGLRDEVVVDFGLSNEFMRPIKTFSRFESVDPLIAITGALSDLQPWECGVFQVLFLPARAPWADSVIRAVTDSSGDCFFADDPEMVKLARQKITRPLFAAVVRIAARSADRGRAWDVVNRMSGALRQFSDPSSNELIPLTNEGYADTDHAGDLLARQSRRCGMLLNSEELVALAHLPSSVVQTERLARQAQRTKAAPASSHRQPYVLGENTASGRTVSVGLSWEQRVRHMHVIGASGTGKSTLLLNLISQDLEQGNGLAVLDPHGDLIDEVLGRVPDDRINDVILVDPSDAEYPVGFNMLAAHSEHEKTLLASDLVAGFRRLATSWGDQMTSVLSNAVLAFLESDRGGTLIDLRRFLVEPEFRKTFLATVRDPHVVYYWQKEFPLLQGRPQASILTRLDTFLRSRLVRNVVSQKDSRLDLAAAMNDGKVLLIKLAQGAIGEENASLLGTLFIAKFHQAALGRQEQKEHDRRPFYLYADEFHNFITPSMASILSGARKYRLGLVLAHQELRQLLRDPDVSSAVLSNAATRVCFRVGDADAEKLADGFAAFTADDLMNLDIGQAVCRIERSQHDFNLVTPAALEVDAEVAQVRRERILAISRERYATKREDVEAEPVGDVAEPSPPLVPKRPRTLGKPRGVPPPTVTPPALSTPSVEVPSSSLGRGGPQHKYLQQLIKRWGEDRGYRATIEHPVLDGLGSVDVMLERDGQRIACEICVTTSVEHELENIQKCVAAGFERVILVALDQRTIRKAREQMAGQISEEQLARVNVLVPEELFASLQNESPCPPAPSVVKGYKVKVNYTPIGDVDGQARKHAITQTVLGAIRKLR